MGLEEKEKKRLGGVDPLGFTCIKISEAPSVCKKTSEWVEGGVISASLGFEWHLLKIVSKK